MAGTLYGVSVGPGDPELITLKAVRIINHCEVIAAPITNGENCAALSIAEKVCDISEKEILKPEFLMRRDGKALEESHRSAAELLFGSLDSGKDVAFLNIGDVTVYSTFSYIAALAEERGFAVEYCAGVASFCAAAAAAKKPLVRGVEPLTIIPAGCGNFDELISSDGTRVVMKSGKSISHIKSKIVGKTVYAVEKCGFEDQKIYDSVNEISDGCGYFTTVIIKD